MLDRRVVVQRMLLTSNDESSVEQKILRVTPARQGLIVTAPDTPRIRAALDQAMGRGEPVVTMVSDVAATRPHAYVGIDNLQAGRTAGLLLARLCRTSGRVLILHSRSDYRAHEARQRGCTEELTRTDLRCEASAETGDDLIAVISPSSRP